MRKNIILIIVTAIMALISSCSKESLSSNGNSFEEQNATETTGSNLAFNFEVLGTKAVKTAWEEGDVINVFFDDATTKAATSVSDIKFVTLTYNGESWDVNTDHAPDQLSASGKCVAVYMPYSKGAISYDETAGQFCFTDMTTYYTSTDGATYTCKGGIVTATLALNATDDAFAQIYSELDRTAEWTLTVKGAGKNGDKFEAGLMSIKGLVFDPATLSFAVKTGEYGEEIKGINYTGETGVVFYGLANLGNDKSLVFELVRQDEGSHYIKCFYNVETFGKGSAIKVSEDVTADWITAASEQKNILYGDGTLIIAEQAADRAYNTLAHGGTVIKVYDGDENLARDEDNHTPEWAWFDDDFPYPNPYITAVEFGKTLKPTSLDCAFKEMINLKKIQTEKLDVSDCTNMNETFSGDDNLEYLDVSKWNVANVTCFDYTFLKCSKLIDLDLSQWKNSVFTSCNGMFYGCTNITNLDLSGLGSQNLSQMEDMFAGASQLITVYVSDKWSTTNVRKGANVFRNCTSLKGGAGTAWNSGEISYTYARIDKAPDSPGYFTGKQ